MTQVLTQLTQSLVTDLNDWLDPTNPIQASVVSSPAGRVKANSKNGDSSGTSRECVKSNRQVFRRLQRAEINVRSSRTMNASAPLISR